MKDLLTEHSLARAQAAVFAEMQAIGSRYVKTRASDRRVAQMRAEIEMALERALDAEGVRQIPNFVWLELKPDGQLAVSVKFLGRVTMADQICDLYICAGGHGFLRGYRTFVARYGDDGPQYSSAPESSLQQTAYFHPALYEACRRWRKQAR